MAEHVQATLDRMVDGLIVLRDYGKNFFEEKNKKNSSGVSGGSNIIETTATTEETAASVVATVVVEVAIPSLLSHDEMASTIGRRRTYEYLLRRRHQRQSDYLQYIQNELQLYRLIQLRYQKYYANNKEFQQYIRKQTTKSEDTASASAAAAGVTTTTTSNLYQKKPVQYIVQHIHVLYQRMIRQYRYSYTVVQQYVDFCTVVAASSSSNNNIKNKHKQQPLLPPHSATISKIYQTAIKYHCTNVQLWYDMIQYEYQYVATTIGIPTRTTTTTTITTNTSGSTTNIATVRILFQRALRFHSQNIPLWKSYFLMELQQAVAMSVASANAISSPQSDHHNNTSSNNDDDETRNNNNDHENDEHGCSSSTSHSYFKVVQVIYQSAIQTIRDHSTNLSFRLHCYQGIGEFLNKNESNEYGSSTTANTMALQQYIVDSIQSEYFSSRTGIATDRATSNNDIASSSSSSYELHVIVRATMALLQKQQQMQTTQPTTTTTPTEKKGTTVTRSTIGNDDSDDTISNNTNSVLYIIQDACGCTSTSSQSGNTTTVTTTMIYYAIQFLRSYYNYLITRKQQRGKARQMEQDDDHELVEDDNFEDDDDDHSNNTLKQIRRLVRDIYTTYKNNITVNTPSSQLVTGGKVTSTDIILEYVSFLLQTNDDTSKKNESNNNNIKKREQHWVEVRNEAKLVIQEHIRRDHSSTGSASLYIQLAKLTIQMENNSNSDTNNDDGGDIDAVDNSISTLSSNYDGAILVLEQALQRHVPIHQQPDHFVLLEQLLCLYIAKVTLQQGSDIHNLASLENSTVKVYKMKIQQLLDQIILVGPKHGNYMSPRTANKGRGNMTVVLRDIPNILIACQHYIPYLYELQSSNRTEQHQHQQYCSQLIDQIVIHPSNVIIHQWILQIRMEQENNSYDSNKQSSSLAVNNDDDNSIPNLWNISNILGLIDGNSAPFSTNNYSTSSFTEFQTEASFVSEQNKSLVEKKANMTIVQELIDFIFEHNEAATTTRKMDRNRCLQMYDQSIYIFQQLSLKVWVRYYQQRKSDDILYGSTGSTNYDDDKKRSLLLPVNNDKKKMMKTNSHTGKKLETEKLGSFVIPMLDLNDKNATVDQLIKVYNQYQIVLVKNGTKMSTKAQEEGRELLLSWKGISEVYNKLNAIDQKSWCIETVTASTKCTKPVKFLSPVITKDRAYCSFVLQNSKDVYTDTIPSLPFRDFGTTTLMRHETAIWFFFGRNPIGNVNMDGRPEHTDAISHNGTWHYQLSGCKRWWVRPTSELVNQLRCFDYNSTHPFSVDCKEGDVLMINTRLWFHQTVIPPQRTPSVSYARDFRLSSSGDDALANKINDDSCAMTNVDGLYATKDIPKGTIIFSEADMPDCELHHSATDSNCEVVELDDGTSAVMASRRISSGDFFCVPESSDDDEYSDTCDFESEME